MQAPDSHITNHPAIMQQVLSILDWTEVQYYTFIYESGLDYLQKYLPNDPEGRKLLEGQRLFWNWWKGHWYARDEAFAFDAALCPRSLALDLYYYLNDATELAAELQPSRVVLGEAFTTLNL